MSSSNRRIRTAAFAALLLVFGTAVADDDRFQAPLRNTTVLTSTSIERSSVGFDRRVDVGGLGLQTYQAAANAPSCVCTNLADVTLICPDCDYETDVNRCVTHDNVCKDRAQLAGIRESNTFFCVSATE